MHSQWLPEEHEGAAWLNSSLLPGNCGAMKLWSSEFSICAVYFSVNLQTFTSLCHYFDKVTESILTNVHLVNCAEFSPTATQMTSELL